MTNFMDLIAKLMEKSGQKFFDVPGYTADKFFKELDELRRKGTIPSNPEAFMNFAIKNQITLPPEAMKLHAIIDPQGAQEFENWRRRNLNLDRPKYTKEKFSEELEAYSRTGKVPSNPRAFLDYALRNRITIPNENKLLELLDPYARQKYLNMRELLNPSKPQYTGQQFFDVPGYNADKFFKELDEFRRTGKKPSNPEAFMNFAIKNQIAIPLSIGNVKPTGSGIIGQIFGKLRKFFKRSAFEKMQMQKLGGTWGGAARSLGREFLGLASQAKAAAPPVLLVAGLGALLHHLYQRMTWPTWEAPWTQYKELRKLINDMNAQQQEQYFATSNQAYHYDKVYAYLEELSRRQQMAQNRLMQAMMLNNPGGYIIPY
jgi:hypothetical protein